MRAAGFAWIFCGALAKANCEFDCRPSLALVAASTTGAIDDYYRQRARSLVAVTAAAAFLCVGGGYGSFEQLRRKYSTRRMSWFRVTAPRYHSRCVRPRVASCRARPNAAVNSRAAEQLLVRIFAIVGVLARRV